VAAIGALFYGALGPDGDFAGAFELSLAAVAAICLAVAALVQLLPGRTAAAAGDRDQKGNSMEKLGENAPAMR
jgi:hypothetical protein